MSDVIRYTKIEINDGGDETRKFGVRSEYSSPTSLYEVMTMATITGDIDEIDDDTAIELPIIRSASNGADFAVIINNDLSLFDFSFTFKFVVTLHLAKYAQIVALNFLEESRIIALLARDGTLILISVKLERITYKMKIREHELKGDVWMRCAIIDNRCVICVCSEDGICNLITIDNYVDAVGLMENDSATENICTTLESLISNKTTHYKGDHHPSVEIVAPLCAQLLYPKEEKQMVQAAMLGTNEANYKFVEFMDRDDRNGDVYALSCMNDRYMLEVCEEGYLTIWDMATMIQLVKKRIVSEGESIKAFKILEGQQTLQEITLILIVYNQNNAKTELQIRSLKSAELAYALSVPIDTDLLAFAPNEEFSIMIVEPYGFAPSLDEFGVRIRVITESQPDARLDRLLNRMKFDDAEIFAKQFNLDMQKVHKSRVNYMLSTLACCDHMEREAFNVFMHYLDLIQDHNWVTEICIAGVTLCRSFEYMSDLLCYVEKRDITDEETLERLSRLRYNLSSYRMLYGPKASFLEDSAWSKFIEDNEWKEIFLHFCDRGYFTEAQIVWQRYLKEMRDWMRDEVDIFQQIIDIIQLVISVDITKLWSALELLETAVLPIALTRDADSTISICVVWLKSLASYLESHHPSEYPTNALNALSILQRVMRSMIQHAITPSEMAEVAYTLLKTRVDSEDCEDFMGQLNVYVKNLKEMKKLKEVYQCPMTYDKFTSETVESICFLMLERVRSVHLIRDNMERFAKPYMLEHHLEFNSTLYNYIVRTSNKCSSTVGDSNPWDERCLAITEMITCKGLRCEALISITKRALPPWSASLKKTVQAVLDDRTLDKSLQSRLRYECDFAALAQIMIQYTIHLETLKLCVRSKSMFSNVVEFVFREVEVQSDPMKRLEDALTIVALSEKVKPGLITRNECYQQFTLYVIKEFDQEEGKALLIKCLSQMEEAERMKVIRNILVHVTVAVNSPVTNRNNELRSRKIAAAICILERFAQKTERDGQLLIKLRAIRCLHCKYSLTVSLDTFENDRQKVRLLKEYIAEKWNANAPQMWIEICNLCEKLFVDFETRFDILLESAIKHNDALSAIQFAESALSTASNVSIHFLNMVMQSCRFTLSMMASMADGGDIESLIFVYDTMRRVISSLILVCPPNYAQLQLALNIATFVEMFNELITQCLTDELYHSAVNGDTLSASAATSKHKQSTESSLASHSAAVSGTDIMWCMDSLIGVYSFKSDGQIYDRLGAVRAVARIARSVIADEMAKKDTGIQADWTGFLGFLSVNNQNLMELCARLFFARLQCFDENIAQFSSNLEQCIGALCERIVVSSPADLWLGAIALLHLPVESLQPALERLRRWATSRKSPEAMIAFLRICQCTVLCRQLSDRNMLATLEQYYARSIWTRKLSDFGATLPQQITPYSVVNEFVSARIPIAVLNSFCDDFGLDSTEATMIYALQVLIRCSKQEDAKLHRELLEMSERAFDSLKLTENIFMRLYDCLMSLCPYDYEAIDLILKQMQKYAISDNEQHALILKRATITLQFLVSMHRSASPTDNELRWYHERKTFIEHRQRSEQLTLSSVLTDGGAMIENASLEMISNEDRDMCSNGLFVTHLPNRSQNSLPFHPFLFEDNKDIKSILLPVIYAEISIYSVELWIELIRQMPAVTISKSDLLAKSILLLVNSRTESGMSIEEDECDRIRSLLFSTTNRIGVAKALVTGIRQIPLCETKMQLLSIGIDVGNMWLGPMGNQLLKPIQADERVKIATFVANLSKSHRRNRTELLLKKVDLLKNETIDLIKSPSDLVVFIYSNAINWNDPIDKKAKLELLNELVALNDLNHTAILDELIESWLGTDATAADAKDGMTDGLMNGNVAVHNPAKDLVYDFPYLDSSVSRIVHLLRSRPPTQAAVYLTSLINKDSNVVLHDTKIRSICCLMRLLSPEQFISILGYDATNVCVTLERLLYSRLINVCRIDLPIQTFIEQNKAHLTKSLLSSGVRQSMELLHFIACVVIDYEVVDRKLIFDLLTKLYGGRQREIVSRLLYLCRLYPALARQHNDLALIWRDIADWMYFSIDDSDSSMNEKLRRYVYFCLSSPVEGRRIFDTLRVQMQSAGLLIAAHLFSLVALPTQKEFGILKIAANERRTEADLQMSWLQSGSFAK